MPVPDTGSQAAASRSARASPRTVETIETILAPVPESERPPPRLISWWEGLETVIQIALAFPLLALLLFLVNLGPFGQPVLRSIFYGLFEGGLLTGLLVLATVNERNKRRRR